VTVPNSDATEQDLVTVRVFGSESEADIAKAALEAFGIHCMLSRDDCGGQRPHLLVSRGIRLVTRSDDAERAEEVLTGGDQTEELS
jgi:hypothetical protein